MTITGATTLTGSATFNAGSNAPLTLAGAVGGTGSLIETGSGLLILAANNTYAGTTTINGGTLQIGNGGTTGSVGAGGLNPVLNGTLAYSLSNNVTISQSFSGPGAVANNGPGMVTLSAANTFQGGTVVNGGTLTAGNNAAFGTGPLTVAAAAARRTSPRPAPRSAGWPAPATSSWATPRVRPHQPDAQHPQRQQLLLLRRHSDLSLRMPPPRQPDQDGPRHADAQRAATSTRGAQPSAKASWPRSVGSIGSGSINLAGGTFQPMPASGSDGPVLPKLRQFQLHRHIQPFELQHGLPGRSRQHYLDGQHRRRRGQWGPRGPLFRHLGRRGKFSRSV